MFPCTYIKSVSCKEENIFYVRPQGETDFGEETKRTGLLLCRGNIPLYPKNTPLLLEEGDVTIRPLPIAYALEHIETDAQAKDFLKSLIPSGSVDRLLKVTGKDIFSLLSKDGKKQLINAGFEPKKAEEFLQILKTIPIRRRFVEEMAKHGVTCKQAEKAFKEYGIKSDSIIRNNPYLLRFFEVPFRVMDKMPGKTKDRNDSLIYEVIENTEKSGHVCRDFHSLCEETTKMSTRSRKKLLPPDPFELAAAIADKPYYVCENGYIYKKSTFQSERKASSHISRIISYATPIKAEEKEIEEIEKELGIKYDKKQKEAFSLFNGISILTGGPGTGKTTVLNGLLRFFEKKRNGVIELCAPTAAAARRMKETTGRDALTIHKLLNIQPTGFGYTSRNEEDPLAADLVVVDEVSMVDLTIFSMLVASIKNGAMLLLIGDKDQLPSVGAGDVLHDLMNAGLPQVHLEKVFRQKDGSIISNSVAIKCGKPLVFDNESVIHRCLEEEEMTELAKNYMLTMFDRNNPEKTRLFVPARQEKYKISTESMNLLLQPLLNPNANTTDYPLFFPGDPIVFTRNNYDVGYMNGDTGIILKKENDYFTRLFIKTDGGTMLITGDNIQDVSLAYAMTVHKSQGSECDTAIILLPMHPITLLQRNLVYVAATRAKRKNIFIVQTNEHVDALDIAIENTSASRRVSNLTKRIEKELKNAAN